MECGSYDRVATSAPGEAGAIQRVKVPPGYIYLVRLMLAEPCEQAFWDAASACLEAVE